MPPKKKQEEIDLASLPECVSACGKLFCIGNKQRSERIIAKIKEQSPFITTINKQQVLDHAKEKSIYIDPATLTEKQKKDAKFMQTICTVLTPEILAKSTKSLIETMNIKLRVEMKANNQKPEQQRTKPLLEKKFDQLYILSDFPEDTPEFQAFAQANQTVKYVTCLAPTISWVNAPQLPEDEGEDGGEGKGEEQEEPAEQVQEDEQIKQLKRLQQKQVLSEDDRQHEKNVLSKLQHLKNVRRQAKATSKFRDCAIQVVKVEIDPYNQEQSIAQAVKTYYNRLTKLSFEYEEFLDWKKDKTQQPIIKQPTLKQIPSELAGQNQTENVAKKPEEGEVAAVSVKKIEQKSATRAQCSLKGSSMMEVLSNYIDDLFCQKDDQTNKTNNTQQDIINNFDFDLDEGEGEGEDERPQDQATVQQCRQNHLNSSSNSNSKFFFQNQNQLVSEQTRFLEQKVRMNLQYPGLDRYMMPDVPAKSAQLRKAHQSHYSQFLSSGLSYEQFQRRLSLTKFQQLLKQNGDQDRSYNLNDRVYCQYHDQKSLMRQLYRAMSLNQSHFLTKYNQDNDSLYVALLYKNNQRRLHSKQWQAAWKVLPNYECWLKYFKQNQNNLNTKEFFSIDYEKIGHIDDQVKAFSVSDGGIIVRKESSVANQKTVLLYAIKNHHLFGVTKDSFYSQNSSVKTFHYTVPSSLDGNQNRDGLRQSSAIPDGQKKQQKEEAADSNDVNGQSNNSNQPAIKSYETCIVIHENLRIRLKETGDVIIQPTNEPCRTYTADGYTIISSNPSTDSKDYQILHPTGGISSPGSYTNERGYGVQNGRIHNVPTLLRKTSDDLNIVKRDDHTVIVDKADKKWIKFHEGTEYLISKTEEGATQIQIQKKNLPFVRCSQGQIRVEINRIVIKGIPSTKVKGQYQFIVQFPDLNQLTIEGPQIIVTESEKVSNIPYIVNFTEGLIQVSPTQNEKVIAGLNSMTYFKNDKQLNPLESEEAYGQNESLPSDYVPPKLFVISSKNKGVEFLNREQLNYYFENKTDEKIHTITKIQDDQRKETVHFVSRVIQESQMNPKRINPDFQIDLDIFKTEKYFQEKVSLNRYTVRSLIKHKNLMPQDREQLESIIEKKDAWLKQARRDQNQFGIKPKGDPLIQKTIKEKTVMIDFRKKKLQEVQFESLKEEAIAKWKQKQNQYMAMIAMQQKQNSQRNKMNQRKVSVISAYPPLQLKQKKSKHQVENLPNSGFYKTYYETIQGKTALSQMPEWIFRPKTAKEKKQLDPQIVTELNNTLNRTKQEEQSVAEDSNERFDTVDINNLIPQKEIYIKPSVFTQREIDEQRFAFQEEKKAYFYHQKKRKDFDLYGGERKNRPEVKAMMRTQPISEINQKYLITQAPLDKKVKTSSMKNKLTSNASSMIQMRKEGPHNTLLKTIDKRHDFNQLLQKRTMMVHADLNDKLQRDILITPVEANFGYLKEGRTYQFRINVKNQDILAQRLVLKKPKNIVAKVSMSEMGPIALGMSRKIIVQLKAASEFIGKYTDEFQIVSKHQLYKIPINATILSESQFQNERVKLSIGVKQIQEPLKRKTSTLPPIN